MAWRVAASLVKMRDQLNHHFPDRKKGSDGTIGDAAHQAATSDHNAWIKDSGIGVVSAFDFTHDPGAGVNSHEIAEYLRQQKDPRIKYVISHKRIFSSVSNPWTWRTYTGSNPHSSHCHVSVLSTKAHYDSNKEWKLVPDDWRPTIRKGDRGRFVARAQAKLGGISTDGDFGAQTEARTKAWQTTHGLAADGIIGPATWKELEKITTPVPPTKPPPQPETPEPDPDAPGQRPILQLGSRGEDVKTVQGLLLIIRNGEFDSITQAAVKGFQRAVGLMPDGIVAATTWEELDKLEQLPKEKWFRDIVTTIFGGSVDHGKEKSAYPPYDAIGNKEVSCALPFRFRGDRPEVEIVNQTTGKRVICEIRDIGPWNVDDDYWNRDSRPQAETGTDKKGRRTNRAGLDVSPQAAREIGLVGKGLCSWAFVETTDEAE